MDNEKLSILTIRNAKNKFVFIIKCNNKDVLRTYVHK